MARRTKDAAGPTISRARRAADRTSASPEGAGIGTDGRIPTPTGRRRRDRRCRWAVALLAIQLVVVVVPVAVVALWAVAARWSWPNLLPEAWTGRSLELLFGGSQSMGLGMVLFSVGVALASAALATVAGALAARAVVHHRWRGRTLFHGATMLPYLIPSTVFAMGIQILFIRCGLAYTTFGVVLSGAIVALPYACALMVDVTTAAGRDLEEAAACCGASPWEVLRAVTIPQAMPGIASSMAMGFVVAFSQYFLTLLVGGGKVRTYALVMFPYLFGGDRTVAGAYGIGFMVITFLVFLLFDRGLRRVRDGGDYYG